MVRRWVWMLLILAVVRVGAQSDDGYAEALRRIEAARTSGEALIDLTHLGLTEVPPEIGTLTQVVVLLLSGNELTTLPPEIAEMTALRHLDLRANQLTRLPTTIADLPQLEKLDLRWNHKLQSVPGWISELEARGCLVYC